MEKASPKNNYHYNKNLKKFANDLRKRMTKGEVCLWKYALKNRIMKGYQFRRQRPIINYIADFACLELLLIIEVDGISHDFGEEKKDQLRDEKLKEIGFTTLRFSNQEVLKNITGVIFIIEKWIETNAVSPPPKLRSRIEKTTKQV